MPKTIWRRKIQANRRNARRSTGPNSAPGKRRSRWPQPAVSEKRGKEFCATRQHERELHRTIEQFRQLRSRSNGKRNSRRER